MIIRSDIQGTIVKRGFRGFGSMPAFLDPTSSSFPATLVGGGAILLALWVSMGAKKAR